MHPDGFHHSEEAKARCWGCSHTENLDISAEDEAYAKQLIADGWLSTSNKYRTVARIEDGLTLEDCIRFTDKASLKVRVALEDAWNQHRRWLLRVHGPNDNVAEKELTVGQFRAFKKFGGDTA